MGYYAQEHETLDVDRTVLQNMRSSAPDMNDAEVRNILGSFLFSGDDVDKPAGVLSGGEKTRLALATIVASSANVLLLDEPTNNLDPASRAEILGALSNYTGAVVLVSHDEGAVEALNPERVVLLPDGIEDLLERRLPGPDHAGVGRSQARLRASRALDLPRARSFLALDARYTRSHSASLALARHRPAPFGANGPASLRLR